MTFSNSFFIKPSYIRILLLPQHNTKQQTNITKCKTHGFALLVCHKPYVRQSGVESQMSIPAPHPVRLSCRSVQLVPVGHARFSAMSLLGSSSVSVCFPSYVDRWVNHYCSRAPSPRTVKHSTVLLRACGQRAHCRLFRSPAMRTIQDRRSFLFYHQILLFSPAHFTPKRCRRPEVVQVDHRANFAICDAPAARIDM